jgi:hypothetical protein
MKLQCEFGKVKKEDVHISYSAVQSHSSSSNSRRDRAWSKLRSEEETHKSIGWHCIESRARSTRRNTISTHGLQACELARIARLRHYR